MNLSRICIAIGAFLGMVGVILGAMGAHALEGVLEPDKLEAYHTAVRYQMYQAFAFLILAALGANSQLKYMKAIAWLWGIGVLLFSGSIFLLVFTSLKVGIVTPIGGALMIAGWAMLLVSALKDN